MHPTGRPSPPPGPWCLPLCSGSGDLTGWLERGVASGAQRRLALVWLSKSPCGFCLNICLLPFSAAMAASSGSMERRRRRGHGGDSPRKGEEKLGHCPGPRGTCPPGGWGQCPLREGLGLCRAPEFTQGDCGGSWSSPLPDSWGHTAQGQPSCLPLQFLPEPSRRQQALFPFHLLHDG